MNTGKGLFQVFLQVFFDQIKDTLKIKKIVFNFRNFFPSPLTMGKNKLECVSLLKLVSFWQLGQSLPWWVNLHATNIRLD
jgi:hypothetical protein